MLAHDLQLNYKQPQSPLLLYGIKTHYHKTDAESSGSTFVQPSLNQLQAPVVNHDSQKWVGICQSSYNSTNSN